MSKFLGEKRKVDEQATKGEARKKLDTTKECTGQVCFLKLNYSSRQII